MASLPRKFFGTVRTPQGPGNPGSAARIVYDSDTHAFTFLISSFGWELFAPVYVDFRLNDEDTWSLIDDCMGYHNRQEMLGLCERHAGRSLFQMMDPLPTTAQLQSSVPRFRNPLAGDQ